MHLRRAKDFFGYEGRPPADVEAADLRKRIKERFEYHRGREPQEGAGTASTSQEQPAPTSDQHQAKRRKMEIVPTSQTALDMPASGKQVATPAKPAAGEDESERAKEEAEKRIDKQREARTSSAVAKRASNKWPRPEWRPPWYNYKVLAGHIGWVRCAAVDASNHWFATGSADRTIKAWDLASGQLKLTLTGHIEEVRLLSPLVHGPIELVESLLVRWPAQVMGLEISPDYPYMFSVGRDKQVLCWDLEANRVIRKYHGHLHGVFCVALHPRLNLLFTGGRDSVCRVWDLRSRQQVHCLTGHKDTVSSLFTQSVDPQIVTGSEDATIRTWDLRQGKTDAILTHHKKGIRALCQHPHERTFVACSSDNIKKYELPSGTFLHSFLDHPNTIVNTASLNDDGVLVTGNDDGSMWFWDYRSGHNFQRATTTPQPGSLESEAGILGSRFDRSGTRLISCEVDKSVKLHKEVPDATPDSHPNREFVPPRHKRRF